MRLLLAFLVLLGSVAAVAETDPMEAAISYYNKGQYAEAAGVLKAYLEEHPDSAVARRLLERCERAIGEGEPAVAEPGHPPLPDEEVLVPLPPVGEGPGEAPTEAEAYFRRGLAYYEKGELRKALVAFDEARHLDPTHDRAREYMDRVERELMAAARATGGVEPEEAPSVRVTSEAPTLSADTAYVIGAGDILSISSVTDPGLAGNFRVDPDGGILYPYLGRVQAGGLTREQLARHLKQKLSEFYEEPEITVEILEYNSKTVLVLGEVFKPGEYPIQENVTTASQAVVMAGLPLPTAAIYRTQVIKPDPARPEPMRVNLYNVLYKGRMDEDVVLEPGDVVVVPSTVLGKTGRLLAALLDPLQKTALIERYRQELRTEYYKHVFEREAAFSDVLF